MLSIPNMVMIGGNSRNSGKTTMARKIISKLSVLHEVIGLKVTSIRPDEREMHGTHTEENAPGFTIFEELNPDSYKDTSKMLRAGATRVFYIRISENYIEKAVLHFMLKYINNQIIVCESRSLRLIINPGLFLMMMRLPVESKKKKDVEAFLSLDDRVFDFDEGVSVLDQFVDKLQVVDGKFIQNG